MKKFLNFIEDFTDDTWNWFLSASMKVKFIVVLCVALEIVIPMLGVAMGWINHFLAIAMAFLGSTDICIFVKKIFFDN